MPLSTVQVVSYPGLGTIQAAALAHLSRPATPCAVCTAVERIPYMPLVSVVQAELVLTLTHSFTPLALAYASTSSPHIRPPTIGHQTPARLPEACPGL